MEEANYNDPVDHSYHQPIDDRISIRRNHNITLWVLLVVLTVSIAWKYFAYQIRVNHDFEVIQGTTQALPNSVNPNTASWTSLARLPGIGETKAKAIIDYREAFYQDHSKDKFPFESPDDLKKVKGIGPATVEKIRAYLCLQEDGINENNKKE